MAPEGVRGYGSSDPAGAKFGLHVPYDDVNRGGFTCVFGQQSHYVSRMSLGTPSDCGASQGEGYGPVALKAIGTPRADGSQAPKGDKDVTTVGWWQKNRV